MKELKIYKDLLERLNEVFTDANAVQKLNYLKIYIEKRIKELEK